MLPSSAARRQPDAPQSSDPLTDEVTARAYSLGDLINEQFQLAVQCGEEYVAHVIECGRLLEKQQARMGHGEWQPWLKKNCPKIPERTARHYMQIAAAAKSLEENGKPCRFDSVAALLDAARALEFEQQQQQRQSATSDDVHGDDARERARQWKESRQEKARERHRRRADRNWERFQRRRFTVDSTDAGVELFNQHFRLFVQCLHPDRAPPDRREQFESATAALNQIRDAFANAGLQT